MNRRALLDRIRVCTNHFGHQSVVLGERVLQEPAVGLSIELRNQCAQGARDVAVHSQVQAGSTPQPLGRDVDLSGTNVVGQD